MHTDLRQFLGAMAKLPSMNHLELVARCFRHGFNLIPWQLCDWSPLCRCERQWKQYQQPQSRHSTQQCPQRSHQLKAVQKCRSHNSDERIMPKSCQKYRRSAAGKATMSRGEGRKFIYFWRETCKSEVRFCVKFSGSLTSPRWLTRSI